MSAASVGNEMKEEKEVMARSREKKKDKRIISLSLSFLDWCFCTKKDSNKKNPKEVIASKRLELLSSLSVFRDRSKTAILLLLLFGTFVSLVEEASTTLTTPGAKSSPSSSPASRTTVTTETPSWEGDSHEGLSWSFVSRNTIMGNTRIRRPVFFLLPHDWHQVNLQPSMRVMRMSLSLPPKSMDWSTEVAVNGDLRTKAVEFTCLPSEVISGCVSYYKAENSFLYWDGFVSLFFSSNTTSLNFENLQGNLSLLLSFSEIHPVSFFLSLSVALVFSFSLPRDTSLFIHRCNGIYTEVSILISFAAFFVCV